MLVAFLPAFGSAEALAHREEGQEMAAHIVKLRTRPQRLRAEQAGPIRQYVLGLEGVDERVKGVIIAAIDRVSTPESEWPFVMINPAQNKYVVAAIVREAVRPKIAVQVWATVMDYMRRDTGEIVATRHQLAEEVGTRPDNISEALRDLCKVGALLRQEDGARFRYFVNPHVGTHLTGVARDKAQATAPKLATVE
jgi:hypothetical protein